MRRHSLVFKWFFSVWLSILLLLSLMLLLNIAVLPSYYQHEKEEALENGFYTIDQLYRLGDTEQVTATLTALSTETGMSITVWNGNRVVYQDRPDNLRDLLQESARPEVGCYVITLRETTGNQSMMRLMGRLNNGYSISMRVSVDAMEESIAIVNRFLLVSGLAVLLCGTAITAFLARRFTRPIKRLSTQAAAVAGLDFSGRYTLGGNDELHDLGMALNRMSDALEQTIAQLQQANEQLTEDNRQKTRQNEARTAFMANVSHELKTPIALIQSYAEMLQEDDALSAADRQTYCEVIEDESQKMSGLIRKMTALMQLEDGSEQLEAEPFDVSELARNLASRFEKERAQKQLTVHLPADTALVSADAYWIENVLTNYLTNALHHTPEGGAITVSVEPADENRLRITVQNTGTPLPPEELPRIWESFYKVDKAHTRAYGGSGIGLSVVAAIMKAHGLPYGVYNCAEPPGVAFFIELPRA